MKIEITQNINSYKWNSFYAQLIDETQEHGSKIRATALGDWKFVYHIIGNWEIFFRKELI